MPTMISNRAAGALPQRLAVTAMAAVAFLAAGLPARAMVGEGADEGLEPVVSDSYAVVSPTTLAAALRTDRDYVSGMRTHHAGALSMSEEYLADAKASSPALKDLARAIIHNQRYEIALLDEVSRKLDQPPRLLDLGFAQLVMQPAASENLALRYRFMKYPVPGPLTPASRPDAPVSERDVQFAKAMTIHHQGALDMARAYQADRNGRNTYLGLLNVDIVTDQAQEIAFMRRIIDAYPGNADAVPVPASMVHGMEGMSHGGHGAEHRGGSSAPAPQGHGAPKRQGPAQQGPTHHSH